MNMKILLCLWSTYAEVNHRHPLGMAHSPNRVVLEDPSVNQRDLGLRLLGLDGPACSPSAPRGALLCRAASVDVIFLGLSWRL